MAGNRRDDKSLLANQTVRKKGANRRTLVGSGNRKVSRESVRPPKTPRAREASPYPIREIGAVILFVLSLASLVSLATFHSADTEALHIQNWLGPIGHAIATGLFTGLGLSALVVPIVLFMGSRTLFLRGETRLGLRQIGSVLLIALALAMIFTVLIAPEAFSFRPGGALGATFGGGLRAVVSTFGVVLLSLLAIGGALVVLTNAAFARLCLHMGVATKRATIAGSIWSLGAIRQGVAVLMERRRQMREIERADREAFEREMAEAEALDRDGEMLEEASEVPNVLLPPTGTPRPEPISKPAPEAPPNWTLAHPDPAMDRPRPASPPASQALAPPPMAPQIVEPQAPPRPVRPATPEKRDPFAIEGGSEFALPSITLLNEAPVQRSVIDKAAYLVIAERLREKLVSFGIEGVVREIRPGPVVTMYEYEPAPGVKISKIASLADDLAMAMEAHKVRIVAPIPGKGVVGIEVPNKKREAVYLRDIVEQDLFLRSPSKLAMALGKNIEGQPYVTDLAKMPHVLIAGTTGSGKSVSVNAMIMSVLFRATPEEVRMIMVDPKVTELSIYEGIPHLLLPVVTDARKAALALRWAVEEMERRYQLLAEASVRNLAGYNQWVDGLPHVAEGEGEPSRENHARLPYLMIVIDEVADLMMVAGREVETYVARLAQMARAAGIHLMVATQRPSTDVITGVIKANFPSRISFQLRSKPDSMTILGTVGAEALLGMGDMLVLPPTSSYMERVHGAFVSDEEIQRVVTHLKAQGKPVYDESILAARDEEDGGGSDGGGDGEPSDAMYDQCLAIVSGMRQISVSMLQRKLRLGYNRAARIIDRMEREGVVGPANGSKPRDVLIRPIGENHSETNF